jgi:transposase-like protein
MKEKQKRQASSAEKKVEIVRRHLIDKVPVSNLCDEYKIIPNLYYRWQSSFFENGALAFQTPKEADRQQQAYQRQIDVLEKKLGIKNEVMAELMAEHLQLKKNLGVL